MFVDSGPKAGLVLLFGWVFLSQLLHIHSVYRVSGHTEKANFVQQVWTGNLNGIKGMPSSQGSGSHLFSPSCPPLVLGPTPSPTSDSNEEEQKVLAAKCW